MYTIQSNSLRVVQPLASSIDLPDIYIDIPYKQYTIYFQHNQLNSTILSMINKALRLSWSKANSYLFSSDDLFIPSMNTLLSEYVFNKELKRVLQCNGRKFGPPRRDRHMSNVSSQIVFHVLIPQGNARHSFLIKKIDVNYRIYKFS
jgi:hypothetical protein